MYRLLFLTISIILSPIASAEEHILTPMLGFSKWSDTSGHTARDTEISFRDKDYMTVGFRYLYLLDNNFAVGANIYSHELDVTDITQAEDAGVAHVHALIEYFFKRTEKSALFAGAGYGFSAVAFSGGTLNDKATAGSSLELNGGVLYRLTDTFGLQLEYKYTYFKMEEEIDNLPSDISSSSHSFLLGFNIHL